MDFVKHIGEVLESHHNVTKVHWDEKKVIVGPNGNKPGVIFQDLFILFSSSDSAVESLCPLLNISKDKCRDLIVNGLKKELKRTNAEYNLIRYWVQKN